MKFLYLLRESIRGFRTAILSTFASVITITLSLILIAIFYTISINSNNLVQSIRDKVELEIFLQDNASQLELDSLRENVKRIGGIKSIKYISKEEAARIFEAEFGNEMLEILDSNPLPASFKVNTYDEYKTIERIEKIKAGIEQSPVVLEVFYRKKNLEFIEETSSWIIYLNLVILIIITISSVFLVSNTIRLVISSKRKVIQNLKLLGATKAFIRTPFMIEGFLQGLLGGILAVIILFTLLEYFYARSGTRNLDIELFGGVSSVYLILAGIALGMLGSLISVRKHLKKEH